ncbi:MAG: assimilatory sulfite reductase (NADPH) flavoprotein subunit [Opitutales bacterium]|nr:assimilatory sulfite reductase (NADPH) flavoprotein subunit [Opitutales bacterium]
MNPVLPPLPDHAPFSAEQRKALEPILGTLDSTQTLWLSGFLAGAQPAAAGQSTNVPEGSPAASKTSSQRLDILFGSESGNAESLAEQTAQTARKAGFKAVVRGMEEAKVEDLAKAENLLVLVSTWGEGDPPSPAEDYYEQFMSDKAPKLKNTRFSVLALGDTSYEHFCKIGKDFDERLEKLGGTRIFPRQDCDVDFEPPFQDWLKGSIGALRSTTENSGSAETAAATITVSANPAVTVYDRRNPFPAPLLENINLNSPGSETLPASAKETRHFELSLEGSGLVYEPGDSLGVFPTNCPEVVEDILSLTKLPRDTVVSVDEDEMPLERALLSKLDITGLSQLFLRKYAPRAKSEHLDALLEEKDKNNLKSYLYGREISDTLADFPVEDLTAQELVSLLRKMPPRLYSIASSLKAHPEEVHLTVAAVRYRTNGKVRKGVASTYLADRVAKGETVPVFVHHNKNFRLPSDNNTPIIMVGPGTGIAPFRAFVEERREIGAKGKNWLFFGDQHMVTDFLYQTEWQAALKDGSLDRIDLAWSRDTDRKVYVQHKMRDNAADLWKWLQDGAYFYVCGDASRMAKDVHSELLQIAQTEGKLSEDDAQQWLKGLQKEKRYQRDVY